VLKFLILLSQVVTLKENREKLWQQEKARNKIPEPTIAPIYFNGYFPINTSISIIAKSMP
jgi:hypothetical protein